MAFTFHQPASDAPGLHRDNPAGAGASCVWAGFSGPGQMETLARLLGGRATVQAGSGFALGVRALQGGQTGVSKTPDRCLELKTASDVDSGATVCIDSATRRVRLARGRFGQRGVYLRSVGTVLWFTSELGLLQQLGDVPGCLDAAALHGYLCLSYVPTPMAIIAGVTALAAGERVEIEDGQVVRREQTAAWGECPPLVTDEAAAANDLRRLLRQSVAARLGNTAEAGVFLSGGIDSSLIAAMLVEQGARLQLFTLDFGPPFDAEVDRARCVAAHLRQPLHVVPAQPAQVRAALAPTAVALDQPFGDGVTVPLYLLGQAAAQHVAVVFNGEGGDQLFGGWANKPMIAAEVYGADDYSREAAYLRTFHRLHGLTHQFYTPAARQMVAGLDAGGWIRPALAAPGCGSLLHRLRAANLSLKGAQNIAPRMAQLAEAHGLAVHAPFFDTALAAWSFSLAPELLLRGACEKYLLKRAAAPYLPPDIVWRGKRGMGVPTAEWCLNGLRGEVGRRLSAGRLRQAGWFDPTAVGQLRRGQAPIGAARARRVGENLWLLLMLQLWLDTRARPLAWPAGPGPGGGG